jgi:hypothetical protein
LTSALPGGQPCFKDGNIPGKIVENMGKYGNIWENKVSKMAKIWENEWETVDLLYIIKDVEG